MNRIKLPLAAVLFTCVVLLSSAAAFASEGESPSPSEVSNWLAPDLDDVQAKAITEEIYDKLSEGTRADATLTDVYNILRYDILPGLKGSVSNSNYSLPRIAYDTRRGLFGSGTMEGTSAWDLLYWLAPVNNLGTNQFPLVYSPAGSGLTYTQAELSGMTWARVGDILSQLSVANSYLSSISSSSDWISNGSYVGATVSLDRNFISSTTRSDTAYFVFNSIPYSNTPVLNRFFVPYYNSSTSEVNATGFDLVEIYAYRNNTFYDLNYTGDYFISYTDGGLYVYIFDLDNLTNADYYIRLSSSSNSVITTSSGSVFCLAFDSNSYQQVKQAFFSESTNHYISHIDSDIHSLNGRMLAIGNDVNALADYLADPDKIAAEEASQAVIDDTLDGFTGNGSAAAKTSDTGAMKNMSGSLQSGLESGASASNATSVFSNQTFWSWFTQSTSNGINSPYPAPVVQQTRGSGDEIPDFLSGNQAELNDLLNQRNSW